MKTISYVFKKCLLLVILLAVIRLRGVAIAGDYTTPDGVLKITSTIYKIVDYPHYSVAVTFPKEYKLLSVTHPDPTDTCVSSCLNTYTIILYNGEETTIYNLDFYHLNLISGSFATIDKFTLKPR